MRQIQEGLLVGITNILFVAEDPPEHCGQTRPGGFHRSKYPVLGVIYRLNSGKVKRQSKDGRVTGHIYPYRIHILFCKSGRATWIYVNVFSCENTENSCIKIFDIAF